MSMTLCFSFSSPDQARRHPFASYIPSFPVAAQNEHTFLFVGQEMEKEGFL